MKPTSKSILLVLSGIVAGGGIVWLWQADDGDVEVVPPVSESVPAAPAVVAVEPSGGAPDEHGMDAGGDDAGEAGAADPGAGSGEPSFEDLMARVFSGEASDEEQLEFWEQMQKTDKIDGVIDSLQEQVDADAEDVTGRMTLAQLYVMKLLSAPNGPVRGLLSQKAEGLWEHVLELEPDHYEAQYRIAFSLSQYPDFLNRTGDAIEAFEKAIAIEERI